MYTYLNKVLDDTLQNFIMKSEQDFVNFLEKLKIYDKNIVKGIGDDCSIISFNSKKKYVFTTETSLLEPHFTNEYTPE